MFALNWGATDGDTTRVIVGDAVVPHPNFENTMAIEIDAEPRHIWPWLIQMGYQRGGHYSYDWLDRLFGFLDRPSVSRILPEYQHLREGDLVPFGRRTRYRVSAIDPGRALALASADGDAEWIWEFGLYPVAPHRTRLVSRRRAQVPPTWHAWTVTTLSSAASFLMTRRMLIGLERRAEALAKSAG